MRIPSGRVGRVAHILAVLCGELGTALASCLRCLRNIPSLLARLCAVLHTGCVDRYGWLFVVWSSCLGCRGSVEVGSCLKGWAVVQRGLHARHLAATFVVCCLCFGEGRPAE